MEIPESFGTSQCLTTAKMKAFGARDFIVEDQEEIAGCPRLYRQRYIDHNIVAKQETPILWYGRAIHAALFEMEDKGMTPEDALKSVWPTQLGPAEFSRALDDLNRYMERGGALTTLNTLAQERWLSAVLYVDEKYGPVSFGGVIDLLSLDDEMALHVTDYKSGFTIPTKEAVAKDSQMKGYAWLASQAWDQLGLEEKPRVLVRLDAIRWREIVHEFTPRELDDWALWAEAQARTILRDEAANPVLNPGCGYCPIRMDCKAFKRLPGKGVTLAERQHVQGLDQMITWRTEAKQAMKQLDSAVKEVEGILRGRIQAEGGAVEIDGAVYIERPVEWTEYELAELHSRLGDGFYEVASVSKKAIEDYLARRGERLHGHELEELGRKYPHHTEIRKQTS